MKNSIFLVSSILFTGLFGCGSTAQTGETNSPSTGGVQTDECTEKSDCSRDLVCVSGQCVLPQCTVDQECSGELKCVEYRCRYLGEGDSTTTPSDPVSDAGLGPGPTDSQVDASPPDIDGALAMDDAAMASPTDAQIADANPFDFDASLVDGDGGLFGGSDETDAGELAGQIAPPGDAEIEPPPECVAAIDCQADERCENMVCVPRCSSPMAAPCANGFVCDMNSGECVESRGCPQACSPGFRCNELEQRCVADDVEPDPCGGECPAGFECNAQANVCQLADCVEDRFVGNHDPESAALINLGITGNLALCTQRDWYQFVVPPVEGAESVSLKVSAGFLPAQSNLEMSLYPAGFVLGQRPLAEAQTDNQPEVLIVDDVIPGVYILELSDFRPLGAPLRSISYDLKLEIASAGFCGSGQECGEGLICIDDQCVEDPDVCQGRCGPLEVCDADTLMCIERCENDQFGGANRDRNTAQLIEAGTLDGLTLCEGESDWYQLRIANPTKLVVEVNGLGDPEDNDVQLELWSIDQPIEPANPEDPPPDPLARSAFLNELNERVEYRFEQPTTALIRVFSRGQSTYSLITTLGESCTFDWDCCALGELECARRCDGVRQVCVDKVCGIDFQCDAPLICNALQNDCVRPGCVEDIYGGLNVNPATATAVPADGALNNMTTCDEDEDWYSLALAAGDGVRLTLEFVDDGFASYDLEFRSENQVLNVSESSLNREVLEYNVDVAGNYFIRVYGALEGSYNLSVDTVPGGIQPIICSEDASCGLDRLCQPGNPSTCVTETCLGANPNVICQVGFVCDDNSGRCRCERSDQFLERNISPQTAGEIPVGFQANLTICGSETDWFSIDMGGLNSVALRLSTDDVDGLEVSVLDAQLGIISDHNIFGNDRIVLESQSAPAYVEIRSKGNPRPLDYTLHLEPL